MMVKTQRMTLSARTGQLHLFADLFTVGILCPNRRGEVAGERTEMVEEVSYVACTTGDRDVSIQVLAFNVVALYKFITESLPRIFGVCHTQS